MPASDDTIPAVLPLPEPKPKSNQPGMAVIERAYLVGRTAFTTMLALGYVLGLIRFPGVDPLLQMSVFVFAVVLLTAATVYAVVVLIGGGGNAERVMWQALPFDLFAAGLLIWLVGPLEDPVYPWLLGLAIAMAAVVRRRSAWMVSSLCAIAYVAGHLFGHTGGGMVFLLFKASALVFTGWMVSDTMHRQAERDTELLLGRESVEDLNEELGRRLAELHAISEITEVIHSSLDFDEVGPLVLDILSKVIDLPSSCLFVLDKERADTLFSASAGLVPASVNQYGAKLGLGEINAIPGAPEGEMFACYTVLDHKDLMVVLCAPSADLERMSEEDKLVLRAVASELIVAVENSQLYKLTKRLSITDELTGLYNYRYLQQRLEDEIERARRYSRSLSLLMLDADDFKHFNDTYGHIAGDRALEDLGEVLRAAVREIDVVCRYGGEEFSVILPETDGEGAFVVAEKIREAVAAHLFADSEGERKVHTTVSIGLASFPSTAEDKEALLRASDDALYQAKHLGRDRVRAPRSETVPVFEPLDAERPTALGGE